MRLFLWSLTSALAGFLFGFDTVVISGAEQTIQSLWGLSDGVHGLAMSMALWGTVIGSVIGGFPTEAIGRKKTLLSIGVLYLVSAIWSAMAGGPVSFMIARLIGGVGVGVSTVAAPMFIAEIAPAAVRGRLTALFQFNIVLGIVVAFLSNALIGSIDSIGDDAWRWMMGVEAIPAVIYTAMCLTLPESPRWLITRRGNTAAAAKVFARSQPDLAPEQVDNLVRSISNNDAADSGTDQPFWTPRLKTPILIAFLVAFFNQLSGINAILYFAPRIFSLTGISDEVARLQAIGIGVVNLIFTFVGLYLIDRAGRRTLLLIGSVGYIISLGLCALVFAINAASFNIAASAIDLQTKLSTGAETAVVDDALADLQTSLDDAGLTEPDLRLVEPEQLPATADFYLRQASESAGDAGFIVLVCIFAFIASHAVGQGAVIWVLISEVFPNRHRAAGQSLGSFTHWIFAALLTLVFPVAVGNLPPAIIFGFFALMMMLQLAWVMTMVPETKGVSLEAIQRQLGVSDDPIIGQTATGATS